MAPRTAPRRRILATAAMISAITLATVTTSRASGTADPNPPKDPKSAPIGYQPTDDAPDDLNAADDDFAACMRDHGQDTYPTFRAARDSDGGISFTVRVGVAEGKTIPDLTSDEFLDAFNACKGPLEDAGVTFSDDEALFPAPGDLPKHPGDGRRHVHPKLPDEHGHQGVAPGEDDGTPSLSGFIRA
ncbi:hypothetical protein [Streptomyces sp. NPDC052225]|uniref:hypothetical protein n=1 Tax=Streptomyces sp. NPDC052225 TaxID=3154949 RepID=UPI00344448CA